MMVFFFFKQKTAYELRISDWSSDVCSSDLLAAAARRGARPGVRRAPPPLPWAPRPRDERKRVVSGKSVSVRVHIGGRRIITQKKRAECSQQERNSDPHLCARC